ncbi:MAG TPA: hypothetical protein VHG93_25985 [Longimicrobium sp.]|nr:hypothetical protein [Longimicrobium sp.]
MSIPAPAAVEEPRPPFDCARCGKRVEGQSPDDARWCASCRRWLISRAGRLAWAPALVVALLYVGLLVWSGLLESPMMAFWLVLGAVLAFVAYKVGRRVFFDVLRGRATGDRRG